MGENYEITALKFATYELRTSQAFLGGALDDSPMPMDFYLWIISGGGRLIAVDTGYSGDRSTDRGSRITRSVPDALVSAGFNPADVTDVILTHLHFDHAGNLGLFPNAVFHVQKAELQFATGPNMRFPSFASAYVSDDIVAITRLLHDGRVALIEGDNLIAPGIEAFLVGGHTPGSQIIRVETERGPVILLGDVAHYYANYEQRRLFSTLYSPVELYEAYERADALAPGADRLIPGHDPEVLHRFSPPSVDLKGWAARLDLPPIDRER